MSFFAVRARFSTFLKKIKKTTPDVFDEKSKTGLGFEIGPPLQKCQCRPILQSMANPAVPISSLLLNMGDLLRCGFDFAFSSKSAGTGLIFLVHR